MRQCKADVYINMGGTAGFPVPDFRGSFLFYKEIFYDDLIKTMAGIYLPLDLMF